MAHDLKIRDHHFNVAMDDLPGLLCQILWLIDLLEACRKCFEFFGGVDCEYLGLPQRPLVRDRFAPLERILHPVLLGQLVMRLAQGFVIREDHGHH